MVERLEGPGAGLRAAGWHVESVNQAAETVVFARGRRGGTRVAGLATSAPPNPVVVSSPDSTPGAIKPWSWEGNDQANVVAHLAQHGWSIVSVADTASQQRGVDIAAERDGQPLLVEVKGWPGTTYARGEKAGQPKPTQPTSQAKHWYADALLTVLRLRGKDPEARVAIALPDMPRYRRLLEETRSSLSALDVRVMFVTENGVVAEWQP